MSDNNWAQQAAESTQDEMAQAAIDRAQRAAQIAEAAHDVANSIK
jgi:hypothetical protein